MARKKKPTTTDEGTDIFLVIYECGCQRKRRSFVESIRNV